MLKSLARKQQTSTILIFFYTEAVFQRCSVKKVFLEISQNSQENTCTRVFFLMKLQASKFLLFLVFLLLTLRPATLLKKRLWRRCFPVNSAKFLRTLFFTEHLRWLLLSILMRTNQYPVSIKEKIAKDADSFFSNIIFCILLLHQ